MIAAVIALAALAALLGGGLVAAVVVVRSSLASERASMAVEGIASRAQLTAERERDIAVAGRAQAELERDRAQSQLVEFQALVQQQAKELSQRVQEQVATGSAVDAVDVFARLLSVQLPGAAAAADADRTSRDPGDAGSGAVSTAGTAVAGGVHRATDG